MTAERPGRRRIRFGHLAPTLHEVTTGVLSATLATGKNDAASVSAPASRWGDALPRLGPSVLPGLLMLAIGAIGSTTPTLGKDEVATAEVAFRPVWRIWDTMHTVDAVVGPYYLVLHAWTSVMGRAELALRAPSIIAMAVAVGLAGELGRRVFSPAVGALGACILCLIPSISRYAQEARPYALACMLSVLATLLLYPALTRPGALAWVGYAVSVAMLGASHIVALTVLAAHAVPVALAWRRDRGRVWVAWLVSVLGALAVLAPLVLLGLGQQGRQLFWVAPLTLGALGRAPGDVAGSVATGWLLVGLALLAGGRPGRHRVELAALVLLPPAALAAATVLTAPLWVPRYLLFLLVPLSILAALAATRGRVSPARLVSPLAILAVLAASAYPQQVSIRRTTAHNGADYRAAAQVIVEHLQAGDGVVYERGWALRAGMDYYFRQAGRSPRDLLLRRSATSASDLWAQEYPQATPRLQEARRVWLVVTGRPLDPTSKTPHLHRALTTEFQPLGLWRLPRTTIALYRAQSSLDRGGPT
jgi:mannosyltransferase